MLRDQAEKVVNCINLLKHVGDAVAGVDPTQMGLPCAGTEALLNVATADNAQMAALLSGMSLAFSMADRLQAYLRFCQQLPQDMTTDNLHNAFLYRADLPLPASFLLLSLRSY